MSQARILNVNDDENNRGAVTDVLARAGYDVLEAATGLEALDKLAALPDLVILDVKLPDLDGFDVARRIRANPQTRLMPVLHLSARVVSAEARAAGRAAGADGYLVQPVEPEELLATVGAILRARRAERELRRSLEQSSVILQNIADAVTAQDKTGRVIYANDAAQRMLGIAARDRPLDGDTELFSQTFDMFDEHGRPLPLSALPGQRVLAGAPEARALIRWRHRDVAEERWTDVKACPVHDDAGQVQLAINIIRDITVAERAERRLTLLTEATAILSASLELETTLQRLASLTVPRMGDWSVVDLVDGRALRRVGTHADAARQQRLCTLLAQPCCLDDVRRLPSPLRTGRAALMTDLGDDAAPAHARDDEELRCWRELGGRAGMSAPLTVRGHTFGAISVVSVAPHRYGPEDLQLLQDLAHRAALALDNARLYQSAQQAATLRRDLLAVVAHDLKNPLNAIAMAAALLSRGSAPEGERTRQQGGIIARAAERMSRLIHDLLDVSAIDAGRIELERQPVAVGALVTEALEALAPLAQEKSIALARDVAPADEALAIDVDRERLLQVFSNLVGNAIKFTAAHGHIAVRVRRRDDGVQFFISDDGPGIAPEHLPHVFDRYWRVRKTTRDGTGLGLSIVKGLVEAHGGTVSVDTTPGRGSTFAFFIPVAT
jgi:signal transduction histidine kinase/DNA-binding response OmpR family regulator